MGRGGGGDLLNDSIPNEKESPFRNNDALMMIQRDSAELDLEKVIDIKTPYRRTLLLKH